MSDLLERVVDNIDSAEAASNVLFILLTLTHGDVQSDLAHVPRILTWLPDLSFLAEIAHDITIYTPDTYDPEVVHEVNTSYQRAEYMIRTFTAEIFTSIFQRNSFNDLTLILKFYHHVISMDALTVVKKR